MKDYLVNDVATHGLSFKIVSVMHCLFLESPCFCGRQGITKSSGKGGGQNLGVRITHGLRVEYYVLEVIDPYRATLAGPL